MHSVVGLVFGAVAVAMTVQTIATAVMPAWYWAIPEGVDVGAFRVDSLGLAFAAMLLAIPLAAITVLLLRGMTIAESRLAIALLDDGGAPPEPAAGAAAGLLRRAAGRLPDGRLADGEAAVLADAAICGLLALLVTAVWAATGAGYFWPAWVYLGLLVVFGLHAGLREAWRVAPERRALAVQGVLSLIVIGVALAVWALAGLGTFWPIWVLLGTLAAFAVHLLVAVLWRRVFPAARERELSERVDVLTETRRGALDAQAAELRRIERDLHDGAQARLVALSMQLGRAEEGLADRPEAAALVRQARSEASAAIAELRDLARGIAPPVLADRGLAAAVEALAGRAPVPVAVEATLPRRLAPVVESAAYFVVAEALTNVAKHAPGARATVTVRLEGEMLEVVVADDGPGGATVATGRRAGRAAAPRRGARRRARGRLAARRRHADPGEAALRVVIAEDQLLLREGLVALLREHEVEVVAQAEDADGLLRIVAGHKPDLAIVDVRLPPTFTDEGIRAAVEARRRHPGLGVLILSQYVEPVYTAELLAGGEGGVGYLLKERVGDIPAFLDAVRRVAAGGTALDREVVAELVGERRAAAGEPDRLAHPA